MTCIFAWSSLHSPNMKLFVLYFCGEQRGALAFFIEIVDRLTVSLPIYLIRNDHAVADFKFAPGVFSIHLPAVRRRDVLNYLIIHATLHMPYRPSINLLMVNLLLCFRPYIDDVVEIFFNSVSSKKKQSLTAIK